MQTTRTPVVVVYGAAGTGAAGLGGAVGVGTAAGADVAVVILLGGGASQLGGGGRSSGIFSISARGEPISLPVDTRYEPEVLVRALITPIDTVTIKATSRAYSGTDAPASRLFLGAPLIRLGGTLDQNRSDTSMVFYVDQPWPALERLGGDAYRYGAAGAGEPFPPEKLVLLSLQIGSLVDTTDYLQSRP